ncbi:tripartite tricarboxylate transporter substrate binding protein [candidate division KSB3 bacterium]|uniref:Tripartite tricarboxylate transporter substrate binding protein n=1 Tax=candidate division KSB3 bacterium TaxID=2044937 RepID=A0A9D5JWE7_9BACT|nr:tripartite tricarboxylate transporter substrate binding protein [candidate division KSB3 bacterium]MBD3325355.1 tripartite tricarboxylate transporter substrate binding protein [candidate division KSB3 bacterium]
MMKHKVTLMLMVAVICVSLVSAASAEYPEKDIKFIINAGAGGGTDTICRKIISIAEKSLDVAIFPVNVPGAASAAGPFEVMKSRPDGYTVGNINYDSVITAIWKELIPGYELEKLNIFALITKEPDALIVPGDSPWATFEEMIEDAKSRPGEIKVADQGVGSRVYLTVLLIEEKFGVEFNKISYVEGSGPQREAILNGEVDAAVTSLGDFAPLLNSGDAKGLVEFSDTQNLTYTDVPPAAELGYPELQSGSFITLSVPADTPDDVVGKLETIFHDAHQTDEFRDWLAKVGVTAAWLGQGDAMQFIKDVQEKEFTALERLQKQGVIE